MKRILVAVLALAIGALSLSSCGHTPDAESLKGQWILDEQEDLQPSLFCIENVEDSTIIVASQIPDWSRINALPEDTFYWNELNMMTIENVEIDGNKLIYHLNYEGTKDDMIFYSLKGKTVKMIYNDRTVTLKRPSKDYALYKI